MKVGSLHKHQYAGVVKVLKDIDERFCRVDVVDYDVVRKKVKRVTDADKLAAKSVMVSLGKAADDTTNKTDAGGTATVPEKKSHAPF